MLNENQIRILLDIANTGCQKGHAYDARIIYSVLLEIKPGFVPAQIGLAFSHIILDDFEVATNMLDAVLEKDSDDKDAQVMLGLGYLLANDKDKAYQLLKPLSEDKESYAGKLAFGLMDLAV